MTFDELGMWLGVVIWVLIVIAITALICADTGTYQFPYVMTVTDANNNIYTGVVSVGLQSITIIVDEEAENEVSIPLEIVKKIEAIK